MRRRIILILISFITGCENYEKVRNSPMINETLISNLQEEIIRDAIKIIRESGEHEFMENLRHIDFGGFRIIESKGKDAIYVMQNKNPIALHRHTGSSYLYSDGSVPLPESFSVEFDRYNKNLSYRNKGLEYFDFGMDGVDAIYDIGPQLTIFDQIFINEIPIRTFFNGKQCTQYPGSYPTTTSCCPNDDGKEIGVFFSKKIGWGPLNDRGSIKQSDVDKFCQKN